MNDVVVILMWVIVAVVSFFSGAAWGAIRALQVNTHVHISGETVTVNREVKNGFSDIPPKPLDLRFPKPRAHE